MASQRQRSIFELFFANTKILHKTIMQAAFHHNSNFGCLGKLDHIVRVKSFGGTHGQRTAIGQ